MNMRRQLTVHEQFAERAAQRPDERPLWRMLGRLVTEEDDL